MLTKISLAIIIMTLGTNFAMIIYSLGVDIYAGYFNFGVLMAYLLILLFIGINLYHIVTKNRKTLFLLSLYFIFTLIITVIEMIYLSSIEISTKYKLFQFLYYFVIFVYINRALTLKKYFKINTTNKD